MQTWWFRGENTHEFRTTGQLVACISSKSLLTREAISALLERQRPRLRKFFCLKNNCLDFVRYWPLLGFFWSFGAILSVICYSNFLDELLILKKPRVWWFQTAPMFPPDRRTFLNAFFERWFARLSHKILSHWRVRFSTCSTFVVQCFTRIWLEIGGLMKYYKKFFFFSFQALLHLWCPFMKNCHFQCIWAQNGRNIVPGFPAYPDWPLPPFASHGQTSFEEAIEAFSSST